MHTITIILFAFLGLQCSAQSFSFDAYLQTNGNDQIHTKQIAGSIDGRTLKISTPDSSWTHRIITRTDYPGQIDMVLSCGGKMTLYLDYDRHVDTFFYACPSLSLYSAHSFVQALKDGYYSRSKN